MQQLEVNLGRRRHVFSLRLYKSLNETMYNNTHGTHGPMRNRSGEKQNDSVCLIVWKTANRPLCVLG